VANYVTVQRNCNETANYSETKLLGETAGKYAEWQLFPELKHGDELASEI